MNAINIKYYQKGFTFPEVILSIAVLSVAVIASAAITMTTLKQTAIAKQKLVSSSILKNKLSYIKSVYGYIPQGCNPICDDVPGSDGCQGRLQSDAEIIQSGGVRYVITSVVYSTLTDFWLTWSACRSRSDPMGFFNTLTPVSRGDNPPTVVVKISWADPYSGRQLFTFGQSLLLER